MITNAPIPREFSERAWRRTIDLLHFTVELSSSLLCTGDLLPSRLLFQHAEKTVVRSFD